MSDGIPSFHAVSCSSLPSRQVEIPPTTPERYITGIYALNVEAPEAPVGTGMMSSIGVRRMIGHGG